jgi:phenylacetate-CoA ligase
MIPRSSLHRLAVPAKRLAVGESLVRRNPLYYPQARRRFSGLTRATLEERRSWTSRRLARALSDASRTAYGRGVNAGTDFERWPLLAPATVREGPANFARTRGWNIPSSTGGTTGIPLPLWRSPRSVAVEQAALDHVLRAHGVHPSRARVAVLRGDDIKPPDERTPPFWTESLGGRRLIFSSNHLERATVGAFAEALRAFRPDYWWVYPSTLESLIRLADAAELDLRVALIFSSSEVLSGWARAEAERRFGATMLDYYGQAERVAFAWSDRADQWFFLPGYAEVELIPLGTEDATRYEIVGTSLWNESMPLVRYRTGDVVQFERAPDQAELQEITLGLKPFPGILGRDGDILIGPDGARLTGIDHFHRGVERIVRIQVVQERADRVVIRVIPAPGFGDRERTELLANARRKLPGSMRIDLELVDELERTALGKTPFVIRRSAAPGTGA